jgi:hypothetical protein
VDPVGTFGRFASGAAVVTGPCVATGPLVAGGPCVATGPVVGAVVAAGLQAPTIRTTLAANAARVDCLFTIVPPQRLDWHGSVTVATGRCGQGRLSLDGPAMPTAALLPFSSFMLLAG